MPALPLAVQTLPLAVVGALVLATLVLTGYAAQRNKDTGDHYVAGRRIGGVANAIQPRRPRPSKRTETTSASV